jgi:pilus assembly protein CpaE
MFLQLTSLIVDADANNRNELASFLSTQGVTTSAGYANAEQLAQHLARGDKPQLVVVNVDPGAMDNLRQLQPIIRQYPDVNFFVMSQVLDPNLLMEAMHLGVKEFVPLPINEQRFKAALERLAGQFGMKTKANVIHVVPTIGGVGSTTVACNVAAALAQQAKTVLIDLDLVRGGVAGYFDQRPRFTIADLMSSAESIDRQVLDNALAFHAASEVAILARPDLPEDSQRVTQQGLQRLLNLLGRMFDYVVLDSMMSVDPIYACAIQSANVHLVTMQLNVPSAKNAERYVGMLRRMGIDTNRIKVVVNRFVKKGWDIEPAEVEKALGLQLHFMIPNDYKNAIAAINFGEPVVIRAPRSEMSQALNDVTRFISSSMASLAKAA